MHIEVKSKAEWGEKFETLTRETKQVEKKKTKAYRTTHYRERVSVIQRDTEIYILTSPAGRKDTFS